MNSAIKIIMPGLASGRVRSTPEVLDVLKDLKRGEQNCAPRSENSGKLATREDDSATLAGVAEGKAGMGEHTDAEHRAAQPAGLVLANKTTEAGRGMIGRGIFFIPLPIIPLPISPGSSRDLWLKTPLKVCSLCRWMREAHFKEKNVVDSNLRPELFTKCETR